MDHYIDILIQPDAEMRENVLLNLVYSKFHKVLCDLSATDIGVSFPEYHVKLGKLLRIHGTKKRLKTLQEKQWLGGLVGYCQVSDVLSVPENTQYRILSRIQTTMSPAKYRRLLARGSITEAQKKQYKAKMFQKSLANPYLELTSSSTGQHYRLFIQLNEIQQNLVVGNFNTYGLSKTATVPWF